MRKIIVFTLLFLVLITFSFANLPQLFQVKQPLVNNKNKTATVTQIIKLQNNNKKTVIDYKNLQNKTALELLKQTGEVKISGKGENAFVTEIGNLIADQKNSEFWAFYINGKSARIGAGSYKLQPNDIIEWKMEKY